MPALCPLGIWTPCGGCAALPSHTCHSLEVPLQGHSHGISVSVMALLQAPHTLRNSVGLQQQKTRPCSSARAFQGQVARHAAAQSSRSGFATCKLQSCSIAPAWHALQNSTCSCPSSSRPRLRTPVQSALGLPACHRSQCSADKQSAPGAACAASTQAQAPALRVCEGGLTYPASSCSASLRLMPSAPRPP